MYNIFNINQYKLDEVISYLLIIVKLYFVQEMYVNISNHMTILTLVSLLLLNMHNCVVADGTGMSAEHIEEMTDEIGPFL